MNVCLSSAGRRAALLECFREAMRGLGVEGRVFVVDSSRTAPTFHLADDAWQVPPCTSPEFIPAVLELCGRERIELVVPTIDTELPAYADHREQFAAAGVAVAVSGPETVSIAADKVLTHSWLSAHGFPTVRQATPEEVLARPGEWRFPLIAKPRGGSAGLGVVCARSPEALQVAAAERDDLVVQEIAPGREHTVNLYVDRTGRCLCAVPHLRMEVRSGEVSKAMTVKDRGLIAAAKRLAETLPEARGPLNFQCFVDEAPSPRTYRESQGEGDPRIRIIEINPRFGGGYPLTHAAGANCTRWLLQETAGLPVDEPYEDWQDGLVMLRYDEAVFVSGERIEAAPRPGAPSSVTCPGG
ncbi:MAG: ATP-grasp domain-containing protein [Armatimonadota bacterium]